LNRRWSVKGPAFWLPQFLLQWHEHAVLEQAPKTCPPKTALTIRPGPGLLSFDDMMHSFSYPKVNFEKKKNPRDQKSALARCQNQPKYRQDAKTYIFGLLYTEEQNLSKRALADRL